MKTKHALYLFVIVGLAAALLAATAFLFSAEAEEPAPDQAGSPRTSGGPDLFGYTYRDSNEPGGPVYAWEEISGSGALVGGWTSYDDGYAGPIPLGFTFDFYGANYTQLYVGTNGYVSFGSGYGGYNLIALFSGDLYLLDYGTQSGVYYQTLSSPTRFVLEFVNIHWCCGYNKPHTFELILYPNGNIVTQYRSLLGDNSSYVGIRNADGTDGLTYGTYLSDELAIHYCYPRGVFLAPVSQQGSGVPAATVAYSLTLTNQTAATDSFTLELGSHAWDSTLSTNLVGPLDNGQSAAFEVYVTVPADADWYATDTLVVTATSVLSPTGYEDTAFITTEAYAPPQISITPERLASTQYVNEIATQPITISNGNGVTLTFRLSDHDTTSGLSLLREFARTPEQRRALLAQRASDAHNQGEPSVSLIPADAFRALQGPTRILAWTAYTDYWEEYEHSLNAIAQYTTFSLTETTTTDPATLSALLADADVFLVPEQEVASYSYLVYIGSTWAGVLSDFVARGGTVVAMDHCGNSTGIIQGVGLMDLNLVGCTGAIPVEVVAPDHPLAAGVALTFMGQSGTGYYGYTSGEEILRVQGSTQTVVSARNLGYGHVVMIGFDFYEYSDDMARLLANAVQGSGRDALWLSEDPSLGSAPPESTQPIEVTFNATGLQPGDYSALIDVSSNDPLMPHTALPVTMTVLPNPDMGWVEGAVTDAWTGVPLTATIVAVGQPYTITTKPDGSYRLWLDASSYMLQASATGYVTRTAAVIITAQAGITQNFALELNVPRLTVTPASLNVTHDVGDMTVRTITITNEGPSALKFDILKTDPEMLVLWNRLGSDDEVRHSEIGENGAVVGASHAYEPAQHGNGYVRKAVGENYVRFPASVLDGLRERGTIELWVDPKVEQPLPYQYGVFGLVGSLVSQYGVPYGNNVWLGWGDTVTGRGLYGGIRFDSSGAETPPEPTQFVAAPFVPFHAAICWDIAGIDGTTDTIRVYRDGTMVGHTTSPWNPAGSERYDIILGTGPDSYGYDKFISDDIRVWNYAKTDFSDRFADSPFSLFAPWLTIQPISGMVPARSSTPVQVTFDAKGIQPGDHTTAMTIMSNDPSRPITSIPVTMTVTPPPDWGRVAGSVSDAWTELPLTATVELVGIHSMTARPDFEIWAKAGSYSLMAYADGYYTVTHPVTIVAGDVTAQDIALEPAQPRLEWSPPSISATVVQGTIGVKTLAIDNTGPLPIQVDFFEINPAQRLRALTADDLAGKRILYDRVHGEAYLTDNFSTLVSDLEAAGATVTENFTYPVTPAVLAGYDVLWVACCGDTNWGYRELSAIDGWMDQGGAVFVHGSSSYATTGPASVFGISYRSGKCTNGTTTDISAHPISEGIDSVYVAYSCYWLAAGSDATVVVGDLVGQPHVVAQEQSGGKMVVLASDDLVNWAIDYAYADNRLLANNIFAWLARPAYSNVPWLSVSPDSAVIPGHEDRNISVQLDASTLSPGSYQAILAIEHNDPDQGSPVEVPVALTVVAPVPGVSLAPDQQEGSALPGEMVVYTLTVTNEGNFTDSFDLAATGNWPANLSASSTGPLVAGASSVLTLAVQVPSDAIPGQTDTTTVVARSAFASSESDSAQVKTVVEPRIVYLPLITKNNQ